MATRNPAPLSTRQRELIDVIERFTQERGYPPTLAECAAALGVGSPRVTQLARVVEAKGYIARDYRTARSMRVVRSPAA